MGSAPENLPAMEFPFKDPKFIFFTDFDGTITLKDSNDYMITWDLAATNAAKETETCLKTEKPSGIFKMCSFNVKGVPLMEWNERDSFRKMLDSVKNPFPACVDILVENIKLDPYFNEYFQWALKNNIPTVVLSGGMTPIIRAILKNLVGADHDKIEIVSNEVEARPGMTIDQEGGWRIKYHDESGFGHDKSLTIRPYANLPAEKRPTLFYAGDGVSDLSAARETDLLFAKKGHDLINYCARENVPFTVFEDWSAILETVKKIVAGETTVHEAAKQGYEDYKSGAAGIKPS